MNLHSILLLILQTNFWSKGQSVDLKSVDLRRCLMCGFSSSSWSGFVFRFDLVPFLYFYVTQEIVTNCFEE